MAPSSLNEATVWLGVGGGGGGGTLAKLLKGE